MDVSPPVANSSLRAVYSSPVANKSSADQKDSGGSGRSTEGHGQLAKRRLVSLTTHVKELVGEMENKDVVPTPTDSRREDVLTEIVQAESHLLDIGPMDEQVQAALIARTFLKRFFVRSRLESRKHILTRTS